MSVTIVKTMTSMTDNVHLNYGEIKHKSQEKGKKKALMKSAFYLYAQGCDVKLIEVVAVLIVMVVLLPVVKSVTNHSPTIILVIVVLNVTEIFVFLCNNE